MPMVETLGRSVVAIGEQGHALAAVVSREVNRRPQQRRPAPAAPVGWMDYHVFE